MNNNRYFAGILICLVGFWPVHLLALDNTGKYYYYTPEQIAGLSNDEKKTDLPIAYRVKNLKSAKIFSEGAVLHLDFLRYPDPFGNLKKAIELFQSDLGDKVSGNLTIGQLFILAKRSGFVQQSMTSIEPLGASLSAYKDKYSDGHANVQGTLTILGEQIASPINSIEINCYKTEGTCEWLQLEVQDSADFDSFLNSFGETIYVSKYETTYKIVDWSGEQIIARPFDGGGPSCRSEVLTLNFPAEEFTLTSTNRNSESEPCKNIVMDRPRVSQIVEGFSIFSKREKARRAVAEELLYSGHTKKVDDLIQRVKAIIEAD